MQIGMPGDVAGQRLADLAADLVDPRRVDDDEPGPFQAGPAGRVVLPPLGRARDGRPVRRADLEDVLAHQRVQDRRLAPADHAEGGDLDRRLVELAAEVAELGQLAGQRGLFLGRELEARRVSLRGFRVRARRPRRSSAIWLSSSPSNSFSSGSAMG